MIPAAFEYEVAESADHAVQLLGQHGDEAKLIAGGHSLLPLMRLRLATPGMLVDIGRLSDLSYVNDGGDHIAIGALTVHADVCASDLLKQHCPIVATTALEIGDPQVRNRGTIGGSIAHGDPASDLPTVLLALDASFVVRGPGGERTAAAADFFRGFFEVDLAPDEMITEIRVPKTTGGWSYQKFHHRAQDWAIVGVAAVQNNGSAAVALTTMGQTPLRASGVEDALSSGASIEDAAQRADENTSPPSDPFGSSGFRRALSKVLTRRALEETLSGR
jgi:aerobic carbon-monoxide dehydrogenase medium subunit